MFLAGFKVILQCSLIVNSSRLQLVKLSPSVCVIGTFSLVFSLLLFPLLHSHFFHLADDFIQRDVGIQQTRSANNSLEL